MEVIFTIKVSIYGEGKGSKGNKGTKGRREQGRTWDAKDTSEG